MLYRQLFPLGGGQIILPMGVQRSKNLPLKAKDLIRYLFHNCLRLRCSQRTVHEVLLHIHNNQKVLHKISSFQVLDASILAQKRQLVKEDIFRIM